MVGLVHPRVRIQAGVAHDPVDEIIHHGGDAIDASESVVEGSCSVS
jgi:hypothetical protein